MKTKYLIAVLFYCIYYSPAIAQYSSATVYKPEIVFLDSTHKKVKNYQSSTYINIKEQMNDTTWRNWSYTTGKPLRFAGEFKDADCTIPHGFLKYSNLEGKVDSVLYMNEGVRHGVARYFLSEDSLRKVYYNQGVVDSIVVVKLSETFPPFFVKPGKEQSEIFVEVESRFPGGANAFTSEVYSKVKYPKEAKKMNLQGKITVQFTVNEQGYMEDVILLNSVEYLLDMAVLRAILSIKQPWQPALRNGVPVKSYKKQEIGFSFVQAL